MNIRPPHSTAAGRLIIYMRAIIIYMLAIIIYMRAIVICMLTIVICMRVIVRGGAKCCPNSDARARDYGSICHRKPCEKCISGLILIYFRYFVNKHHKALKLFDYFCV